MQLSTAPLIFLRVYPSSRPASGKQLRRFSGSSSVDTKQEKETKKQEATKEEITSESVTAECFLLPRYLAAYNATGSAGGARPQRVTEARTSWPCQFINRILQMTSANTSAQEYATLPPPGGHSSPVRNKPDKQKERANPKKKKEKNLTRQIEVKGRFRRSRSRDPLLSFFVF